MRILFYFLLLIFTFSNCSENHTQQPISKNSEDSTSISNSKFYPISAENYKSLTSQSGISTSPNIILKDGQIIISLVNGQIQTRIGNYLKIVKDNQINGTLILKDAVTLTKINGTTTASNSEILISPEISLDPKKVYSLIFIDANSGIEHKENIYIAGANYCDSDSYFAKTPIQSAPKSSEKTINIRIKNSLYQDPTLGAVAVVGWDHLLSQSFNFKIDNRTHGANYKIIKALSSYNIPNHECELFYQRAIQSPFPVWTDNDYGYKVTKVTNEDTSIQNQSTNEFYKFTKTYLLVKVFNSSNVDITESDNGVLSLQQTDSLYGLPISFNNEEESSLLAYLNKGNNNSYSMVLGGLVVGIFGFFLSRKLIKRKED